jgi:hypothetical protein
MALAFVPSAASASVRHKDQADARSSGTSDGLAARQL